jgi:hypothetical protein
MGNNYLNRGESLLLTTHSVSVDGGLYDILLTNERIVFVDNRYTRFEPRTLPFTQIISVKGGRVPTGEPVITLVLTETGALTDSRDQHLIFTQQPGEERRHERDLWVKRLIELVISERQHAVREETAPHQIEPGVKPSVRRWEAPDHLRPRSAPEKEPAPAHVVVEPDVMEFPEFLFEEPVQPAELREEQPGQLTSRIADTPANVPEEAYLVHSGDPEFTDDILADAGTGIVEVRAISGDEVRGTAQPEPFSSTVRAAIAPLLIPGDLPEPAVPPVHLSEGEPGYPPGVHPVPVVTEVFRNPSATISAAEHTETGPVRGQEINGGYTGLDEIGEVNPSAGHDAKEAAMPLGNPDSADKPRLSRVSGSMTGQAPGPDILPPPNGTPQGKRALKAATLAVLGILILVAGVFFFSHILPDTQGGSSGAVITPVVTISPSVAPALENIPSDGVRVRVESSSTYLGAIGNPGSLHPVSGSGDQWYTVLNDDDLVSATLQKQDNSGTALTVEIYNNGTLLTSRTVTAPMGEIALLIDPKTGSPPGIIPVTMSPANVTRAATLTYY